MSDSAFTAVRGATGPAGPSEGAVPVGGIIMWSPTSGGERCGCCAWRSRRWPPPQKEHWQFEGTTNDEIAVGIES